MGIIGEPIILLRNENGRFCKQIRLGNSFIDDIDKMSTTINNLSISTNYSLKQLNFKINSLVSNRIIFNLKGIDFSKESFSDIENNSIIRVVEGISDGLCSLINDFANGLASGDPMVYHDHIVLLFTIYSKIRNISIFPKIIRNEQKDMVEQQFIECFESFNKLLMNVMTNNTVWIPVYNNQSSFFGSNYFYAPVTLLDSTYFNKCKIEYQIENKIIDDDLNTFNYGDL